MKPKKDNTGFYITAGLIIYVFVVFFALHVVTMAEMDHNRGSMFTYMLSALEHMSSNPFDITNPFTAQNGLGTIGALSGIFLLLAVYIIVQVERNEHASDKTAQGSAKFLTNKRKILIKYTNLTIPYPKKPGVKKKKKGEKTPFKDRSMFVYAMRCLSWNLKYIFTKKIKPTSDNVILAKNVYLKRNIGDNINTLVLGSAGTGKSFGLVKPNILQKNNSYVVTDPSGEILASLYSPLINAGYHIRIFSTSNLQRSSCYNPFDYLYDADGKISETAVTTMLTIFMENASGMEGAKKKSGDPFWEKAAKALLMAVTMYILEFEPKPKQNFNRVLKLVQMAKADESESAFSTSSSDNRTGLDRLLDEKIEECGDNIPKFLSYYETFKLAPAKTANSILISAAVDLQIFQQEDVRNMTSTEYAVEKRVDSDLFKRLLREKKKKEGELTPEERKEIIKAALTTDPSGVIEEYPRDENGNPVYIKTENNLNLSSIGDEKTALFINIPQADTTFSFLVAMMYSQLFKELFAHAESSCQNKFMIVDENKQPVITLLNSKDEADKVNSLYKDKNTRVVPGTDFNGNESFFIQCQPRTEADQKYLLASYKGQNYLKEFKSKEYAERFLEQFRSGSLSIKKESIKKLPWHVDCILDEFANIGKIPNFPELLATMRKYEISCMIIIQAMSQLKEMYDKSFETIKGNCRAMVCLGSSDLESCEYISKLLGKTTIKVRNTSRSISGKGGSSHSTNITGRELLSPDEVAKIPPDNCIVFINGEDPIYTNKNWCYNHEDFEQTGDANPDLLVQVDDLMRCSNKKMTQKCASDIDDPQDMLPANDDEGEEFFSNIEEVKEAAQETMNEAEALMGMELTSTFESKKEVNPTFDNEDDDEQLIDWSKPKTVTVDESNIEKELSGMKKYVPKNPLATPAIDLSTSLSNIPQDYIEDIEDEDAFRYPGKKGGK